MKLSQCIMLPCLSVAITVCGLYSCTWCVSGKILFTGYLNGCSWDTMNTGSVCVVSYDLDWLLGDSTCLLSDVQTCVALCNSTGGVN